MDHYLRQGLISSSKVLDIRQVDVRKFSLLCFSILNHTTQLSTGTILENNVYVFIITFATQELMLFRNAKSGEIVVGSEDKVEQCHYAAVITRVEEDLNNELTGGWKIVEVHGVMFR
jgi:import inner membrane translocase subunit TIM44